MPALITVTLLLICVMALAMTALALKLFFYKLSVAMVELDIQPTEFRMRESVITGRLTKRPAEFPSGVLQKVQM